MHASLGAVSCDLLNNYFLLNTWDERGFGREKRPGIRVNLRVCLWEMDIVCQMMNEPNDPLWKEKVSLLVCVCGLA